MTAPTRLLQFGTYVFPSSFYLASAPQDSALEITSIPYRDGAVLSRQRIPEKIIEIRGTLLADSVTDLRTKHDALIAALNGGRQSLYIWADRYAWANKRTVTTDYDPASQTRYADYAISFVCDTGYWEAASANSDTWASPINGGTRTLANSTGNAPATPSFAVTFASGGSVNLRLAIGSDSFTLVGSVGAGDVILIDSAAKTVTLQATGANRITLFDGQFLGLAVGNNTLTLTVTSGVVPSQIVTSWRNRWY